MHGKQLYFSNFFSGDISDEIKISWLGLLGGWRALASRKRCWGCKSRPSTTKSIKRTVVNGLVQESLTSLLSVHCSRGSHQAAPFDRRLDAKAPLFGVQTTRKWISTLHLTSASWGTSSWTHCIRFMTEKPTAWGRFI